MFSIQAEVPHTSLAVAGTNSPAVPGNSARPDLPRLSFYLYCSGLVSAVPEEPQANIPPSRLPMGLVGELGLGTLDLWLLFHGEFQPLLGGK